MLFSLTIQEKKKENVRQRYLQFENGEVTKRIGLPHSKPKFKQVPTQSTQTFDLKRPA